jgi:thiosulfate dehydrogenase [quinone] large subunit
MLQTVDFINAWGLFAIGLGLILGLLTRFSLIAGISLLFLYYLSHPPFVGLDYALPMEGNYLLVNKVLIEMVAMIVIVLFPTGKYIGLDRFIFRKKDEGNGRSL